MFVLEDDAKAQAHKKNIWKSQNFLLSLYQKLIIKIFKGIML